jgi:hypothetical protein
VSPISRDFTGTREEVRVYMEQMGLFPRTVDRMLSRAVVRVGHPQYDATALRNFAVTALRPGGSGTEITFTVKITKRNAPGS